MLSKVERCLTRATGGSHPRAAAEDRDVAPTCRRFGAAKLVDGSFTRNCPAGPTLDLTTLGSHAGIVEQEENHVPRCRCRKTH